MPSDKSPNNSSRSAGLTSRTLLGFQWSYFSMIVQAVLQLAVISTFAHFLTPRDFGLIGLAVIFTSLAERFGELGVGPAVIQRQELSTEHIRVAATLSILMGVMLFAVFWVFAPDLAIFFNEPALTTVLRAISLTFVLESFGTVPQNLLTRQLRFKALMAVDNISYFIGNVVFGISLALAGFGVWSMVVAQVMTRFCKIVLLQKIAPISPRIFFALKEAKELLSKGVGFSLGRLLNYCALQGDNFVVGRLLGTSALGIYGRAYQLMTLPANYFGKVLDRVLFPAIARRQENPERLCQVYLYGTELVALVGMPASVFLFLTASDLVMVLFGRQWDLVIPVLEILSVGVFFRTAYKNSDTLTRALGAVYSHALRQGLYTAFVVLGAVLGTRWGLNGVAFGVLVAVALNYLLMSALSLSLLRLSWQSFGAAHLPALWVSFWLGLVLAPALVIVRSFGIGELLSLLIALMIGAAVSLLALYLAPRFFRLSSAPWMLENIPFQKLGKLGNLASSFLHERTS